MPHALLHASDSDADFGRQLCKFRRGRKTSSLVFHLNENSISTDCYAYSGSGAVRVLMDVGKAFLNHSKDGGFQIPRHTNGTIRKLEINEDSAAFRKAFDECAQGREDTQFLEQGWVEGIGKRSHLLQAGARKVTTFVELRLPFLCCKLSASEKVYIQGQHRQVLAGCVVQFTGETSALVILERQQPARHLAKLLASLLHFNRMSHGVADGREDLFAKYVLRYGVAGKELANGRDILTGKNRHTKSGPEAQFPRGVLTLQVEFMFKIE